MAGSEDKGWHVRPAPQDPLSQEKAQIDRPENVRLVKRPGPKSEANCSPVTVVDRGVAHARTVRADQV